MTSKDILLLHAFSNEIFAYSCAAPDMTSADLATACCTVSLQKLSYIFCLVYVLYSYQTGLTKVAFSAPRRASGLQKIECMRYRHGYLSVEMSSIWSSWCHYHLIISCFTEIQNRLTFPGASLPTLSWKNMPLHGLDLQNCPLCFTMVGYLSTCWALVPCWHQCLSSLQCFDTASRQARNLVLKACYNYPKKFSSGPTMS